MSTPEQAAATILAQVALAADGAVLGVALGYIAVRSFIKFSFTSSAVRKISRAPLVRISDLRDLISSSTNDESEETDDGKLVMVRGNVEAKSVVDGEWKNLTSNILVSIETGDSAVALERTQTYIYNEWKGIFGWTSDIRTLFGRSWKQQESFSLRTVPFVLTEDDRWPHVIVNLDGSKHPLPLTTTYHHLQPVKASPYTFLQALFGHEYPVGLLEEEKILPVGKVISAVGICSSKDGVPEIKPCHDLPYFLSEMTKEQMLVELDFRAKFLFWTGIVVGAFSVGILGYAITRNWSKWKEWRQRRQSQEPDPSDNDNVNPQIADEETEDIPDGELCVICLLRRRRSAFIPCGHMVCCQRCASSVERESTPKCPLCRQGIRNSIRIYST